MRRKRGDFVLERWPEDPPLGMGRRAPNGLLFTAYGPRSLLKGATGAIQAGSKSPRRSRVLVSGALETQRAVRLEGRLSDHPPEDAMKLERR